MARAQQLEALEHVFPPQERKTDRGPLGAVPPHCAPRRRAGRRRTGIQRGRLALQARGLSVRRRTLVAAAAAIGLAMASSTAAQTEKCKFALIAEWPLRADQYRPVIDGAINEQKIGILLDTGAAQSSIRPSGIRRLGLARFRVEASLVPGVGVDPGAEFVHLDEVRIG